MRWILVVKPPFEPLPGSGSQANREKGPKPSCLGPPFCAGRQVMSPNDGTADHLHTAEAILTVVKGIKDQLPKAGYCPSAELPVVAEPFAELFRQVSPG